MPCWCLFVSRVGERSCPGCAASRRLPDAPPFYLHARLGMRRLEYQLQPVADPPLAVLVPVGERWVDESSRRTCPAFVVARQRRLQFCVELRMYRYRHRLAVRVLARLRWDKLNHPAFEIDRVPSEAAAVAETEACVDSDCE